MPIAGMRTLESFGESVIEDYYDLNKRQTDVLNPPIRIDSLSVVIGHRGVLAISPSCSDFVSGLPLSQYTSSSTCQVPNGEWWETVDEYCSNATYSTEVNCIAPNGTWTAGTCSGGSYSSQVTCEASGICSNSDHNNNELACLGEGTCSDPIYNHNEPGCTGAGGSWVSAGNSWTNDGYSWTPGSCSDIGFTDEVSCLAPRAVWTPEITEHCQPIGGGTPIPEFTSQLTCNAQRGIWDMTNIDLIEGTEIELTGDGIDLEWEITIGSVVQNTSAILLPTRVKFEVTAGTVLGTNEFKITNTAGDYFTYPDPFTVTDSMRIRTVYQPSSQINPYGEQYASSTGGGNWMTGHQSAANQAEFYIDGIGFVDGCTVTVKKSSVSDHPQNYLAGGDNSATFTATPYDGVNVFQSSTELMCIVDVTDIPASHDASLGASADFGVMYYDVTVTNPDGSTFTKIASAVPGARMHALDNGASYCDWRTDRYDAGNAVRIWGYTLPRAPYVVDASLNGTWNATQSNNTWDVQGEGFESTGGTTHDTVVTIESWDGKGIVYTPVVQTWSGNQAIIRITNGAVDVNTGAYPPIGSYRVTATNPDGAFDDSGYLVVG
jgi:hypothetical protein